jgi:hypothetical protein
LYLFTRIRLPFLVQLGLVSIVDVQGAPATLVEMRHGSMKSINVELAEVFSACDHPCQHLETRDVARIVPKAFVIKVPERQLFAIVVISSILLPAIICSLTHLEASRFHIGYAAEERPRRPSLPGVVRDQQKLSDPGGVVAF